ncbi:MAG: helix-hairpin-helix domain-containing protein [Desulfovibrionaceae bacterium]
MDSTILKEFMTIPGVGKAIAQDLWQLGFRSVAALAAADPESMYRDLETLAGTHVDRCMLYVFRCAVYYASHADHDPELLKWWNWKDGGMGEGTREQKRGR